MNDLLSKITDPYERNARLYPALLAMSPIIILAVLLYGAKVSVIGNVVGLVVSCGGLYLMTNACRELGKRLEPKLFETWGGKPTTQLLRYKDATIEGITKRRYHAFLSGKINEPFPNQNQEEENQKAADDLYQSGIRWLLNNTRDAKKFHLLFNENIAYGFRRNALGIKPIGLTISIASFLWVLFTHDVITGASSYYINASKFMALPETAVLSLIASAFMAAVWILFITKKSVRTAAFTYAEMLLRSCDILKDN